MEIPTNFKAASLFTAFSSLSLLHNAFFVGEPMGKQEEGRRILMNTVILNLVCLHKEAGLWADVPQVL